MFCRAFVDKNITVRVSMTQATFRRLLTLKYPNFFGQGTVSTGVVQDTIVLPLVHVRGILHCEEAFCICALFHTSDEHQLCCSVCIDGLERLCQAGWTKERTERVAALDPLPPRYSGVGRNFRS